VNVSTENMLLDALVQKGVLISVSVRYWRAQKKLNAEDLGLTREQINDRLISLGHKRLVPKEKLERLALLEGRAHALVEENTFPFLDGIGHYLPNAKLEEVVGKLRDVQTEFEQEQRAFISDYSRLREEALQEWREAARSLPGDAERLLAVIRAAFPAADRLPARFSFDLRLFQISVPEVPRAELVELGTQQELIEARREAARRAQQEIEQSCRDFIAECVFSLREQTAQLCSEMLQTLETTGNVHQKTLNRLTRFIDHFAQLNFVGDEEMQRQLHSVREQFLQKSAGEYRDKPADRQALTQGLEALRSRARELAAQDARDLVQSFGQVGRRRFTLAA
jgi:hypothetical protein